MTSLELAEKRITELLAENERLREDLETAGGLIGELQAKGNAIAASLKRSMADFDRLKAEVELVAVHVACGHEGPPCLLCPKPE